MSDNYQKIYPPIVKAVLTILLAICFHHNMKAQEAIVGRETANGKRETAPGIPGCRLNAARVGYRLPVTGYQGQNAGMPYSNKTFIDSGAGNLPPNKRVWLIAGAHVTAWTASYIALNKAWYDGFAKSDFHFFNDNHEWNQMDKAGHIWTAYRVSRLSAGLWKWAGLNGRKSAVLGGISGLAYQSIIEIQDGFSSEWGFSWGDMAANFLGAATFVSQELGWREQRFQFKLSYWAYDYNSPDLKNRRNQLFGASLPERLLKDYNSQTYWLSANIASFLKNSKWPSWLNMAVGYSSNGMLGGFGNQWTDKQGNIFDRADIHRERHFLLSPDIDLTKIHSGKKWVRTLLSIANMVKIPAPAIGLGSKGKLKAYALYY
ncbi:DUF2279 domain-containing protein [Niastella populi]|uniref:DUF2279 domain-containing protein n=1 Tax=Niastella populi TaxID=550983 RepID=UPI0009BE6692|nr:DUF2279 domain-containing protein [Niastella populi]